MDEFESLLQDCINAVKRLIYLKIRNQSDAEDVLQETLLSAHQKLSTLRDKTAFKAWILRIARNKCNDYYRQKAADMHISLEDLTVPILTFDRCGICESEVVSETLDKLGDHSKQILYLHYFKDLPLEDIAKRLGVPLGTVKSRLHYARKQFKENYPYTPKTKGAFTMKKLPTVLPNYTIKPSDKPPFDVTYEELLGLSIIPRLHEETTWGSYACPSGKLTEYCDVKVIGKAAVHEIEGVEIIAVQHRLDETGQEQTSERQFIAQLTDTHCRYLAQSHIENGVKKIFTFLDSDVFANNWGYGEDNCGVPTHLSAKGRIIRKGTCVTVNEAEEIVDVVGRYEVTIGGRSYDTICVMDVGHFGGRIAVEQFLDQNGRTILWRRFNRDDWAIRRYKKLWSEQLPQNDRLTINGTTYVHWYDCITDYIV